MQLDITGHHVEITESLRDYVVSKLEKLKDILTWSRMCIVS